MFVTFCEKNSDTKNSCEIVAKLGRLVKIIVSLHQNLPYCFRGGGHDALYIKEKMVNKKPIVGNILDPLFLRFPGRKLKCFHKLASYNVAILHYHLRLRTLKDIGAAWRLTGTVGYFRKGLRNLGYRMTLYMNKHEHSKRK